MLAARLLAQILSAATVVRSAATAQPVEFNGSKLDGDFFNDSLPNDTNSVREDGHRFLDFEEVPTLFPVSEVSFSNNYEALDLGRQVFPTPENFSKVDSPESLRIKQHPPDNTITEGRKGHQIESPSKKEASKSSSGDGRSSSHRDEERSDVASGQPSARHTSERRRMAANSERNGTEITSGENPVDRLNSRHQSINDRTKPARLVDKHLPSFPVSPSGEQQGTDGRPQGRNEGYGSRMKTGYYDKQDSTTKRDKIQSKRPVQSIGSRSQDSPETSKEKPNFRRGGHTTQSKSRGRSIERSGEKMVSITNDHPSRRGRPKSQRLKQNFSSDNEDLSVPSNRNNIRKDERRGQVMSNPTSEERFRKDSKGEISQKPKHLSRLERLTTRREEGRSKTTSEEANPTDDKNPRIAKNRQFNRPIERPYRRREDPTSGDTFLTDNEDAPVSTNRENGRRPNSRRTEETSNPRSEETFLTDDENSPVPSNRLNYRRLQRPRILREETTPNSRSEETFLTDNEDSPVPPSHQNYRRLQRPSRRREETALNSKSEETFLTDNEESPVPPSRSNLRQLQRPNVASEETTPNLKHEEVFLTDEEESPVFPNQQSFRRLQRPSVGRGEESNSGSEETFLTDKENSPVPTSRNNLRKLQKPSRRREETTSNPRSDERFPTDGEDSPVPPSRENWRQLQKPNMGRDEVPIDTSTEETFLTDKESLPVFPNRQTLRQLQRFNSRPEEGRSNPILQETFLTDNEDSPVPSNRQNFRRLERPSRRREEAVPNPRSEETFLTDNEDSPVPSNRQNYRRLERPGGRRGIGRRPNPRFEETFLTDREESPVPSLKQQIERPSGTHSQRTPNPKSEETFLTDREDDTVFPNGKHFKQTDRGRARQNSQKRFIKNKPGTTQNLTEINQIPSHDNDIVPIRRSKIRKLEQSNERRPKQKSDEFIRNPGYSNRNSRRNKENSNIPSEEFLTERRGLKNEVILESKETNEGRSMPTSAEVFLSGYDDYGFFEGSLNRLTPKGKEVGHSQSDESFLIDVNDAYIGLPTRAPERSPKRPETFLTDDEDHTMLSSPRPVPTVTSPTVQQSSPPPEDNFLRADGTLPPNSPSYRLLSTAPPASQENSVAGNFLTDNDPHPIPAPDSELPIRPTHLGRVRWPPPKRHEESKEIRIPPLKPIFYEDVRLQARQKSVKSEEKSSRQPKRDDYDDDSGATSNELSGEEEDDEEERSEENLENDDSNEKPKGNQQESAEGNDEGEDNNTSDELEEETSNEEETPTSKEEGSEEHPPEDNRGSGESPTSNDVDSAEETSDESEESEEEVYFHNPKDEDKSSGERETSQEYVRRPSGNPPEYEDDEGNQESHSEEAPDSDSSEQENSSSAEDYEGGSSKSSEEQNDTDYPDVTTSPPEQESSTERPQHSEEERPLENSEEEESDNEGGEEEEENEEGFVPGFNLDSFEFDAMEAPPSSEHEDITSAAPRPTMRPTSIPADCTTTGQMMDYDVVTPTMDLLKAKKPIKTVRPESRPGDEVSIAVTGPKAVTVRTTKATTTTTTTRKPVVISALGVMKPGGGIIAKVVNPSTTGVTPQANPSQLESPQNNTTPKTEHWKAILAAREATALTYLKPPPYGQPQTWFMTPPPPSPMFRLFVV